jgi:Coatomer subunit gamma-1 C-terminal appendage platform
MRGCREHDPCSYSEAFLRLAVANLYLHGPNRRRIIPCGHAGLYHEILCQGKGQIYRGCGRKGFADEFRLDYFELTIAHLMAKPAELPSSFKNALESLGPENEAVENFALDAHNTAASAVNAVTSFLGMVPCEGMKNVSDRAPSHTLLMSGVLYPDVQCMLHAKLSVTPEDVAVDLMLQSED